MDVKIEVQWHRAEIEELLERDLNERGFAPFIQPGEEEAFFSWKDSQFDGASLPMVRVVTLAQIAPRASIPPGTLVVHPPVAVAPPPPSNPQPRKTLSQGEIDELAKLLPHPEYANQILSTKTVIREMMPGESLKRPN
jgi:hypothetical protein